MKKVLSVENLERGFQQSDQAKGESEQTLEAGITTDM